MTCSLIRTEKSTLEYIAAKFFQQIQFFSLKMQKNNGPVMFRSGTVPPYLFGVVPRVLPSHTIRYLSAELQLPVA